MQNPNKRPTKQVTSWEPVQQWYRGAVGDEGLYYHQKIVIPGVLRLLAFNKDAKNSILDLACGTGILARHIPKAVEYCGFDISPSLIKEAKRIDTAPHHQYFVADATQKLPLPKKDFTHAAIVLALQNMKEPQAAIQNAASHLCSKGTLVIAMNHPCFRIPRQSSWKVDEEQKIQFRRIDRYSTPMSIPIQANPSKGEQSAQTWSFHYPLADYSRWLYEAGFAIELIEEWHSDKASTGKAAKMENRSREEFPLFLAIRASKRDSN